MQFCLNLWRRRPIAVSDISARLPPASPTVHCASCQRVLSNTGEESVSEHLEFGGFIAAGGFAEVHQVWYKRARAAAKVLSHRRAYTLQSDEIARNADGRRLIFEARVLRSLNHPNFLRVFTYSVDPPLMVVEYHQNGCIRDYIQRHRFVLEDPRWKMKRSREIASAMRYLHSEGRVLSHGDLTTRNILISASSEAIVCDVGLAKVARDDPLFEELPDPGDLNLCRQAPEVIQGGLYGEKGDVYQLGIIMYELLTGEDPFGDEETICPHNLHREIARDRRRPKLPEDRSEIPGWCPILKEYENVMNRCCSDYQDHRPTFAEIEEMLTTMLVQYDHEVAIQEDVQIAVPDDLSMIMMLVLALPAVALLAASRSVLHMFLKEAPAALFEMSACGLIVAVFVAYMWHVWPEFFAAITKAICGLRSKFGRATRAQSRDSFHTRNSFQPEDRLPLLERSPFDIARPPTLCSTSLTRDEQPVLNLPVPSAEIWNQLRCSILHELLTLQTQAPWRYQLHNLCQMPSKECPTQQEWEDFKTIFTNNPEAHRLRAWMKYENLYNTCDLVRTETSGHSVNQYPDEGPSTRMGNDCIQQTELDDFFAARVQIENDPDGEMSGLSRTSTGVITENG